MHEIIFYVDSKGNCPVGEFIDKLIADKSKESQNRLRKIREYIRRLHDGGTQIGMPVVRHIDGKIWELRPIKNRVMFFTWIEGKYVLLHIFEKKTQQTPSQEIARARREMNDWLERND